jgi:hypothetical protein
VVGRGFVGRSEAEQRLEAGERGVAPVVPEDELVEVDLQVLGRDANAGRLPRQGTVASPFVVFERDEVSSVAGSLLLSEASEAAPAGPQGPV